MSFDVSEAWRIAGATGIALMGGLARVIMRNDKCALTPGNVAKEMLISGFAGLMIFLLVGNYFGDGYTTSFLSGMAGYTAPYTLSFLTDKFKKMVGIVPDAPGDKNVPK